jgi:hypothetical protein
MAICTGCYQVNLMFPCFSIVTSTFLEFFVPLSNYVSSWCCISLMVNWGMSVEHWWSGTVRGIFSYSEKYLSLCPHRVWCKLAWDWLPCDRPVTNHLSHGTSKLPPEPWHIQFTVRAIAQPTSPWALAQPNYCQSHGTSNLPPEP